MKSFDLRNHDLFLRNAYTGLSRYEIPLIHRQEMCIRDRYPARLKSLLRRGPHGPRTACLYWRRGDRGRPWAGILPDRPFLSVTDRGLSVIHIYNVRERRLPQPRRSVKQDAVSYTQLHRRSLPPSRAHTPSREYPAPFRKAR